MESESIPVRPQPDPEKRGYQAVCVHINNTDTNVTQPGCGEVGGIHNEEADAQDDWRQHVANNPLPLQHEGIVLNYIAPGPPPPD
jgi:hypothetical protein